MKIKALFSIAFLLLLFSCRQSEYKQKILGDWKLVGYIFKEKGVSSFHKATSYDAYKSGFIFYGNDTCYSKAGFPLNSYANIVFFKPKTTFKLDGDSLSIFNNVKNNWMKFRIKSIAGDTMLFNWPFEDPGIERYCKYVRQHSVSNASIDFDQVIITNYSTWGLCSDISIDKAGKVIDRVHLNLMDAIGKPKQRQFVYYTTQTSTQKFSEILDRFQKTDFDHLNAENHCGTMDGPEVSLTFIKNCRVIKTLQADENCGPYELVWAYLPLKYLDHGLSLDSVKYDSKQSPDALVFGFRNKHGYFRISPSMCFYLSILLKEAKETGATFNKVYDVSLYGSTDISKMETDGRFYQITWSDGSRKTYDIGLDFIAQNAKCIKFENLPPK